MSQTPTPPYAPQSSPPSRGFPWVACVIIGGLAFVFVTILTILAVGYLIFMKPVHHPAPMSPAPMPQMMQPSMPPPVKEAPPPSGATVSADEAIEKVKALPEVVEWVGNVTAAGGSPHIEVDSEDAASYTVHAYEMVAETEDMPGHTATMGWYTVDKATTEVREMMP